MEVPDAGTGCLDTSKSPPNVVENPHFECESTTAQWRAIAGTLEFVTGGRSGKAAKVTMKDALGAKLAYSKPIATNAGMKTFCVTAYISGNVPFMKTQVFQTGGTGLVIEQADQVFSDFRKTPTDSLMKFGFDVPNGGADKLELVFMAQTNRSDGMGATVGQYLIVDDVDVWESTTRCGESGR